MVEKYYPNGILSRIYNRVYIMVQLLPATLVCESTYFPRIDLLSDYTDVIILEGDLIKYSSKYGIIERRNRRNCKLYDA
jgi:hypothetical protein